MSTGSATVSLPDPLRCPPAVNGHATPSPQCITRHVTLACQRYHFRSFSDKDFSVGFLSDFRSVSLILCFLFSFFAKAESKRKRNSENCNTIRKVGAGVGVEGVGVGMGVEEEEDSERDERLPISNNGTNKLIKICPLCGRF